MIQNPNPPAAPAPAPVLGVLPLRFSADAPAMIAFLRTLGMAAEVTTAGEDFATLVAGGGGRVMVHGADGSETGAVPGETQLCLAVERTDEAADALAAHDLEVRVWDETYGRQGVVVGPCGETVSLNEQQRDLYGYEGHDGDGADPRLAVCVVRSSEEGPEREADVRFFAALGFTPVGPGDRWWQALAAPGAGVVGLHAPHPDAPAGQRATGTEFGDVALVRLGFETDEDLEQLAARLTAAGHPARVVREEVTAVHVTDPDGLHLEIHPRSRG